MKRYVVLSVVAVLAAAGLGLPAAGGVISVTNVQNVGTTLDLSPAKTYTHKLDFPADGQSAVVNGVQFSPVAAGAGTDPLTGKGYNLTGAPTPWGSGSNALLHDFHYGGNSQTLTLSGLTFGNTYDARLYYRNFGARPQNATIDSGGPVWSGVMDEYPPSASDRNYWSIVFTAENPNLTINFNAQGTNATWHNYAVSNELVDVGPPVSMIRDLFNTGVASDDDFGLNAVLLADGQADPHYEFITGPQSPPTLPQAQVQANHPAWSANGPDSKWIGVTASGSNNVAITTATDPYYEYETTFTIPTDLDPGMAHLAGYWFADNHGGATDILVNGISTGLSVAPFNAPLPGTYFQIDGSPYFQDGLNTLTFRVINPGAGPNPHGLRVNRLVGWVVIPEPSTLLIWSLLAGLGVGVGWRRRRR